MPRTDLAPHRTITRRLSTAVGALAASVLLGSGLVVVAAPSTSAAPLAALASTATPGAVHEPSARPTYKPYGKAWSKRHVLRKGCKFYSFSYRVNPPTDEWTAELFMVNPNGRNLLSLMIDSNADPAKGTRRWSTQICRRSTVFGKHKIKMKVVWTTKKRGNLHSYVEPTTFRFVRPQR